MEDTFNYTHRYVIPKFPRISFQGDQHLTKEACVWRGYWSRWTFAKTPCAGRINPA